MISSVLGFITFLVFVLIFCGPKVAVDFLWNMFQIFPAILNILNEIVLAITGDHIITILLGTTITFFVVGLLLEIFNIPRGKFGSAIGSLMFWLVGFPVSFILNFIGRLFF